MNESKQNLDANFESSESAGKSKKQGEKFPPERTGFDNFRYWSFGLLLIGSIIYILVWVYWCDRCSTAASVYIATAVILISLISLNYVYHRFRLHKARKADLSTVHATIVEARNAKAPVRDEHGKEFRPIIFAELKKDLLEECSRLENIGNQGWTDFQFLPLQQMLLDFYNVDELISTARLYLERLKDYPLDNAYPYYWDSYYSREGRIEEAIKAIEDKKEQLRKSKKMEPYELNIILYDSAASLRAETQTLLENIADFDLDWSDGSAIIRGIRFIGVVGIPILLFSGLLPAIDYCDDICLPIVNWGMLGIVGAITAVLLGFRKLDLVDVGNTKGKQELARTILAAVLGLVAGILTYFIIAGELISGSVIPEICCCSWKNFALSVVWAFTAGFSFEKLFDRINSSTLGSS